MISREGPPISPPIAIGVFASGRGSNARAVDAYLEGLGSVPIAHVALVVSNNPKPSVFDWAEERTIPYRRLSPKMYPDAPEAYADDLLALLDEYGIAMILLAGYMRKLPAAVVGRYRGRILNIHPALLPDFGGVGMYGMNVHRAVIEARRTESGVTVHLADEEYDTGAILAQQRVPVMPDDSPEELAARVLAAEHHLLPRVVAQSAQALAEGKPILSVATATSDGRTSDAANPGDTDETASDYPVDD